MNIVFTTLVAIEMTALVIGTGLLSWATDWQTGVAVGLFVWYGKTPHKLL
jgi:hypothetical protein